MLRRAAGRHGSCCGGPPGPDCADYTKGKGAQRALEKRQWQQEEDMEWRSIKEVHVTIEKSIGEKLSPDNYAMEARFEGPWVMFRTQEEEGGEVFEYAIRSDYVPFMAFWPKEGR